MPRSDRFLQVPQLKIYNLMISPDPDDEDQNSIPAQYMIVDSFMKFDVMKVVAYCPDKGPQIPESPGDLPYTLVHLSDGVSFISSISCDEFEDMMNAHFDYINK